MNKLDKYLRLFFIRPYKLINHKQKALPNIKKYTDFQQEKQLKGVNTYKQKRKK